MHDTKLELNYPRNYVKYEDASEWSTIVDACGKILQDFIDEEKELLNMKLKTNYKF